MAQERGFDGFVEPTPNGVVVKEYDQLRWVSGYFGQFKWLTIFIGVGKVDCLSIRLIDELADNIRLTAEGLKLLNEPRVDYRGVPGNRSGPARSTLAGPVATGLEK